MHCNDKRLLLLNFLSLVEKSGLYYVTHISSFRNFHNMFRYNLLLLTVIINIFKFGSIYCLVYMELMECGAQNNSCPMKIFFYLSKFEFKPFYSDYFRSGTHQVLTRSVMTSTFFLSVKYKMYSIMYKHNKKTSKDIRYSAVT